MPTPSTTRRAACRSPSCAATTSAATSAVRSCRRGKWRDKLFFFVNYEQEYIPQTQTRTQTLLTTEAHQGIFRYQTAAGEQRTANVLQIAAQNGFPGPGWTRRSRTLLARQAERAAAGRGDEHQRRSRELLTWDRAAEADQLLPDRAPRLSDHAELLVDGQLEPVPPGRAGPPHLALRRLADPARHVPQLAGGSRLPA